MLATRLIPASVSSKQIKLFCLLPVYLIIATLSLQEYIKLDSLSFVLGLLSLPFTVMKTAQQKPSALYAIAAAICLLLSFLVPVKTILFFSIGFSAFCLMQSFAVAPRFLSCAALFFMAPVFQYVANTFSFPIRLTLTKWVGQVLQFSRQNTAVDKNSIYYNGNTFSVDPACMGLNMLVTSLLVAVMLIGFYQKKYNKELRWYQVVCYLMAIVVFNCVGNVVRIFLLVHFTILPDNILHEIMGLLCLALYVALPATVLAKQAVRKWGKKLQTTVDIKKESGLPVRFHIALLVLIGLSSYYVTKSDTYTKFRHFETEKISGYAIAPYAPGILKVESSNALIYIKYVRGFYDTDHNPTLCWKGSGYTFKEVQKQRFGGAELYTATLVNGTEKLYTAWCYSNGNRHTTSQAAWRWDLAKNGNVYALVNITAATKEALNAEIATVLTKHSLHALFNNP